MALAALSGDEQCIIFSQLCNVLDTRVAVAFSSASSELRALTQALTPSFREALAGMGAAVATALFVGARSRTHPRLSNRPPRTAPPPPSSPLPTGTAASGSRGSAAAAAAAAAAPAPSLGPREQQPRRKQGQPERHYSLDRWRTGLYAVAAEHAWIGDYRCTTTTTSAGQRIGRLMMCTD